MLIMDIRSSFLHDQIQYKWSTPCIQLLAGFSVREDDRKNHDLLTFVGSFPFDAFVKFPFLPELVEINGGLGRPIRVLLPVSDDFSSVL